MNDEAESSRAGQRRRSIADPDTDNDDGIADIDLDEDIAQREQRMKERRLDAKRKRVVFLDHLLRELDTLVFLELITLYHLDCSFFWFAVRAIIHGSLLTPLPDIGLHRQHDEHKPWLPLILFCFAINFLLHTTYPAPSAGEDTRGYLHGGLMIDFIGQLGPTSKWKLAGLDTCILFLQLVMVSVHVKRRQAKKTLAQTSAGSTETSANDEESTEQPPEDTAAREQDADAEERGVLRRTDTLSDIGIDPDEEDALLSSSEGVQTDALDVLISGQCIIGEFSLIDTLLDEHQKYQAFRQTRSEGGAASSLSPTALRQLQNIRMRFGVGGG
ncbi:hypothetical protein DPSP01_005938 [Paraphaeosphaeria sporulosa]|uniref:DUF1746-domain-containing protein n=1 Tax=Paraphaeosphaeria sporulosa TaxID=1460663 RepID=A0A177CTE9_9PLEO|nr:DUF1746-domain-containing protein [Paraphaeosphaeria sporulosa]OAG10268.1 DUF1746-domain-containing protein [Paraphaeosphaeria sporulosa]